MRLKPRIFRKPQLTHPLARGLIGYWLYNEGSGLTTNDLSGSGNYGTINSATWAGDSLLFDENNPDSVTFATPPKSVTKQGTVVFSFFPTGNTGNFDRIFDHRNAAGSGVYFQYRADADRITFNVVNTDPTIKGLSVSGVFPEDEWHCVAFTWTQFFRAAYRNGQLVASNSDDMGTPRDLDAALTFMLNVNGNLKDVVYYDRVLSAGEILELARDPYILFRQDPAWMGQAAVAPSPGQVIFITKAERETAIKAALPVMWACQGSNNRRDFMKYTGLAMLGV